MLRRFISRAIFVCVVSVAGNSYAESDHAHEKGPNGGEVKSFGKEYHLEAVRSGNEVSFNLLGSDGKSAATLDKHDGGSIMIVSPGAKPEKKVIEKTASLSSVRVQLPNAKKASISVNLKIGGKNLTAKFSL